MTSYQSRNLVQTTLKKLIPGQIVQCENSDELPSPLKELILHNFQAKYVCYDQEAKMIEIGVENPNASDSYPDFKIYSFKLKEAVAWLGKTFRKDDHDLKFYAKLIAQSNTNNQVDDVVLV